MTWRYLVIVTLVASLLAPSAAARVEGDSGGPSIANFHKVEPWLYRGGRPDVEGVSALGSIGIRTIVTLERGWFKREPTEVEKERLLAKKANIQFIHVPLHPFFKPQKDDISNVLSIVTDPDRHPVFIHCRKGRDRTGIIIAAFRIRYQGWNVDRAYGEMESFGHRSIFLFWWKDVLREVTHVDSRNIQSIRNPIPFEKGSEQRSKPIFLTLPISFGTG